MRFCAGSVGCTSLTTQNAQSYGASMAPRSGQLVAAPAGEKKCEPDEPEDHALGRSRGGWGTKIHILCDAQEHPLHLHLSADQAHDFTQLDHLLIGADRALHDENGVVMAWPVALAGDKGYRAVWIDEYLLELGIKPSSSANSGRPSLDARARPSREGNVRSANRRRSSCGDAKG